MYYWIKIKIGLQLPAVQHLTIFRKCIAWICITTYNTTMTTVDIIKHSVLSVTSVGSCLWLFVLPLKWN